MEKIKGITRQEFDSYTEAMWKKLKEGEEKYGLQYDKADIKKAMLDEAVDLSNYSFMLFLQATKFSQNLK